MSYAGVPAVAMAPSELAAKQWKRIYGLGVAAVPPMVVSCSACFAFLAYQSEHSVSTL